MISHYGKIQEILDKPGERLTEAQWAMDWCETYDENQGKVYMVAGLIPAVDSKGVPIDSV
jgi:hypothetical protein